MTDRLPCETLGCLATILPTTAAKTGGICMPCHQKKLDKEEKMYILQNRQIIDPYKDASDPIAILKIMHSDKEYNPMVVYLPYPKSMREVYQSLTKNEIHQLQTYAISLIEEENIEQAESILLSLVCYINENIERALKVLLQEEIYSPHILFKDAGSDIRDHIIELLQNNPDNCDSLVSVLAWIGDEKVEEVFREWRDKPPEWSSTLYIPVENYTHEAGWELDRHGQKRYLFSLNSHIFRVNTNTDRTTQSTDLAVKAMQMQEKHCLWCANKLVTLFSYNLQHTLTQFLNLDGQELNIVTCLHCNCYTTLYMEVSLDGTYSWSNHNILPSYLPIEDYNTELTWHTIQMSEQMLGTYEDAHWALETYFSRIGGHPNWVQESEYPTCPHCSTTMPFMGQISMEQICDSEGTIYAFLCRTCLITATNYQQT